MAAPKSRRERREADEEAQQAESKQSEGKQSEKTLQAKTTSEQASKIKDDGFDPDPEVARQVGGDRAAKDAGSDPKSK